MKSYLLSSIFLQINTILWQMVENSSHAKLYAVFLLHPL